MAHDEPHEEKGLAKDQKTDAFADSTPAQAPGSLKDPPPNDVEPKTTGRLQIEELWASRHLKPYFNDFVLHHGYAYGFDGNVLACIDMATGKRVWKGGRYGFGQILLLVDMSALLVVSETGDIVLLRASPDDHSELGRFKAIDGKTWNHPVIARGKLFVRNSQEAACFQLPIVETAPSPDTDANAGATP